MTHSNPLSQDVISKVARGIGERLASPHARDMHVAPLPGTAAAAPFEIGESLVIYRLGLDAIQDRPAHFEKGLAKTGRWHHQVRRAGEARYSAQSTEEGEVLEVVASPIAEAIDHAIDWIDQNVQGDPLASLLAVPAYLTTAVWLKYRDADEIVVAHMPRRLSSRLQMLRTYSAEEFLGTLRDLEPVSMGTAMRGRFQQI